MAAPYPSLAEILSAARVQVNDAIQTIGGNTLTDDADFTPVYVNRAWQQLQQYLASLGYVRFRVPNLIIPNLPPVNNEDVALQVFINWYGYSDGVAVNVSFLLPQNLIRPLKLSERPSDTSPNVNAFIDMDGPEQGVHRLPSIPKREWNGLWVWDNDAIWMPGALAITDLRIDYASYLPDFTGSGEDFPGDQTADIMRCEDALAGFIAAVFCAARGDLDASTILSQAKDAAKIIAGVQPAEMPVGVM